MNASIKFKDGKLSEFSHNSIYFYNHETYVNISRIKYNLKFYDIGTTVPITDEEMQMLKGLIKE